MKNSKIVALVATAALLVIAAAFTSMAAAKYTWYQVDGIWHCKDKNGDDICQDWAKSGNDMYYLDENGEMAVESFLEVDDDYYYVDADGKMVKNDWKKIENTEEDDGDDAYWYYFQNSGKAKKGKTATDNKPVTINGKKYLFGDDARMLYGWVCLEGTSKDDDYAWQDAEYYCGGADDGAVKTGWVKVDVLDNREDTEDQSYWFYFNSNGKKVASENTEELLEKTVNGKKYAFDWAGVMKAEWEFVTTSNDASTSIASTSIDGYAWFQDAETGAKLKKGWFRVIPKDKVNPIDNDDEVVHWFYAKGSGELAKNEVKTINGKKYAFNEKGEMVAGLWYLDLENLEDYINNADAYCIDTTAKADAAGSFNATGSEALYFFGDEETDGAMKTGTIKTEVDGDEYTFIFDTTGSAKYQGHKGIKGSSMYFNGAKLTADSDLKYQAFEATFPAGDSYKLADIAIKKTVVPYNSVAAGNCVLVSSSGAVVKSGTKKDADEHKYYVKNYKVQKLAW